MELLTIDEQLFVAEKAQHLSFTISGNQGISVKFNGCNLFRIKKSKVTLYFYMRNPFSEDDSKLRDILYTRSETTIFFDIIGMYHSPEFDVNVVWL